MSTILVVEDEPTMAESLAFNLERQGHRVLVTHNGLDALRRFDEEQVDLVLLDVMLPGLDGLEVCRRIRAQSDTGIIMLTARGEEIDRVLGLEIGADDYLTKPFSLRELNARVRALLRRTVREVQESTEGESVSSGDLRLALGERRAWRGEELLHLRPQEFDLLAYLMRHRAIALTRQQILNGAWGSDFLGTERTVDVHVRALRSIVEDDPARPKRIATVRGVGYRFEG